MAIRDGVDVGVLGLLQGCPLRPPSQHLMLARTLFGAALGSLAIDSKLSDEAILAACQAAIDHRETSLSAALPYDSILRGNDQAEYLAFKLLRMAVQELFPIQPDIMGLCRSSLPVVRAAAVNSKVINAVSDMTQAMREAP